MNTELLHKFFSGTVSQDEINSIKNWAEQSVENKKQLIIERKIYDAIQLNLNDDIKLETPIYIEDINPGSDSDKKIIFRPWIKETLKIASVAVIVFIASWFLLQYNKPNANTLAMQTIEVPSGQRINLILPDGTSVWLNSNSKLQYPIAFNSKERRVFLDGQAYFDVARNEEVPFIVSTKEGTVQALGTAFDVISSTRENIFETMLIEGSVEVKLFANPDQKLRLKPNMKAVTKNNLLSVTYVEDKTPYEWRNGLISFRNKEFKEIMTILEKTYDVKIVLMNPIVGDQVYTGKFRISDGVQYALDVLSLYKKIEYRIDYENHIIYIE